MKNKYKSFYLLSSKSMNITRVSSASINSELERLFNMQTNDEKVGEIKLFLRNEKTKISKWSKDEYYRLLRLIESCVSQFRSTDGRIERERIEKLISEIPSLKKIIQESKIGRTVINTRERIQKFS